MSLLKKPEVEGVTIGPPIPAQVEPKKFEPVQTGVKLTTALPEDPVKAAARAENPGIREGIYQDNSGGRYVVIRVVEGHVVYARMDGGAAQVQVRTFADFL